MSNENTNAVAAASLIADSGEAGYCSIATAPLSKNQMTRIVQCATTGQTRGIITVFSEKTLIGKGTRKLFLIDDTVLVEYAGVRKARYLTKDANRFESMARAAIEELENENVVQVVLLGTEGMICRSKALVKLHQDGVVVMRCPHLDSDNSEETDEDEEVPVEEE